MTPANVFVSETKMVIMITKENIVRLEVRVDSTYHREFSTGDRTPNPIIESSYKLLHREWTAPL